MKPQVLAKNLLLAAMVSALGVAGAAEKMDIGKMEYGESCAACHGVTGKGDGPFAAQLKSPMPNLTVLSKNNGGVFPTLRVYNVIDGRQELLAHGTREMPIWGTDYQAKGSPTYDDYPYDRESYVRGRILALIDYLSRLQEK
jgi:mono/diheme cytochrome c family protein